MRSQISVPVTNLVQVIWFIISGGVIYGHYRRTFSLASRRSTAFMALSMSVRVMIRKPNRGPICSTLKIASPALLMERLPLASTYQG